ncbi:protein CrcB, partial [Enterococcus faecium]
IGMGAFLGGIGRYLMDNFLKNLLPVIIVVLIINIFGCFFIGIVSMLIDNKMISVLNGKILTTGFCGGLTSFSSFINNMFYLVTTYKAVVVITYIVLNLLSCIFLLYFGRRVFKKKKNRN